MSETAGAALPALHLVTDAELLGSPEFRTLAARVLERAYPLAALHVRGHGVSGRLLHELTAWIAASDARPPLLLVNDRVDVALTTGADGVQLGRRSIPVRAARDLLGDNARIGFSAHSAAEAAEAEVAGADFCVLGAVYETRSHPQRAPLGVRTLGAIATRLRLPVIAIGGIGPAQVAEVLGAGAAGVAVLSGVWRAPDPERAIEDYRSALESAARQVMSG